MFKNPIKQFRLVGFAEGISFLLLLGIAMPLKYIFDYPLLVTIIGYIHGVLFMLYVLVIILVTIALKWSFSKTFLALLASVIPFGPFLFDSKILRKS